MPSLAGLSDSAFGGSGVMALGGLSENARGGPIVVALDRHQLWTWFSDVPMRALVTILAAVIVRWIAHRAIGTLVEMSIRRGEQLGSSRAERVIATATGLSRERHTQRVRTLGSLLRSAVTVAITVIALLTVMALLQIPLGPLLASAGVGGVALGFGAQSLVRDFLSGVFMIMEDQYGVGDVIDTGEAIGTVEDVSLRITTVRDANGVLWFVRNGEIVRIGNRSQGWAMATIDLPVGYDADVEEALDVLRAVVHTMDTEPAWADQLVAEPEVVGVESVAGGVVTLRILARCAPGHQFAVQREIRRRGKEALDRAGIVAPIVPAVPHPPTPGGHP